MTFLDIGNFLGRVAIGYRRGDGFLRGSTSPHDGGCVRKRRLLVVIVGGLDSGCYKGGRNGFYKGNLVKACNSGKRIRWKSAVLYRKDL